ncbi:MAG: WbqC family protein, partial [Muribaculaceae bacterium]|nr:WbqC family protein [Muribaculaceae bacterium]
MITHGTPIIIGSQTAASIHTFAAMMAAGKVWVDSEETRLPLRHSHHRYSIATAGGPLSLTVSITGNTNAMPVKMKDVEISEHAKWRHLHWGALFSAYGKTPYFDYIADELHAIVAGNQTSLLQFNTQLQQL